MRFKIAPVPADDRTVRFQDRSMIVQCMQYILIESDCTCWLSDTCAGWWLYSTVQMLYRTFNSRCKGEFLLHSTEPVTCNILLTQLASQIPLLLRRLNRFYPPFMMVLWRACNLTCFSPCLTDPVDKPVCFPPQGSQVQIPRGGTNVKPGFSC
jgi:hypothetical protein